MEFLNMKPHGTSGFLITFCGLDGCGKTTMIRRTLDYLAACGRRFMQTKEPTDAVRRSDIFRTYMDKAEHGDYDYRSLSLLAASDRIQHTSGVVMPALKKGEIVISDRYFYSCLANLRARGYKEDKWIYDVARSIPKPDLAFFFDVPVETAVARVRARPAERERYIDMDLQYRLREEYIAIAEKNGGILLSTEETENQTFDKVKKKIDALFERRKDAFPVVRDLLMELAGQENIALPQSLSEDLALDSLGRVSLMIELEEALGVEFGESDLDPFALETVEDVIRLAERYLSPADEVAK